MAVYRGITVDETVGANHGEHLISSNEPGTSVLARIDFCWSMGIVFSQDGDGTVIFAESPAVGLEVVNNGAGAYDISSGYAFGTTVALHGHGPATPGYAISDHTLIGDTAEVFTSTRTWRGHRKLNVASDLYLAWGQPGNQQNSRIFKAWIRVTLWT